MPLTSVRQILGGSVLAGLAGCSFLPMGEDEFNCPASQNGGVCESARAVYQQTHVRDELTRTAAPAAPVGALAAVGTTDAWYDRNEPPPYSPVPVTATATRTAVAAAVVSAPRPVPAVSGPLPLLSPAQVMRIWIGPWVDAEGNLHAPGYVFTQIEARQWEVGLPGLPATEPLQLLQSEPRPPAGRDPRRAAGTGPTAGGPPVGLPPR